MIVFVSPAKNMRKKDLALSKTMPQFLPEAEELLEYLLQMNDEDIMNILEVNAKLTLQIQQRLKTVKFDLDGGHAIISYHGLVFQNMHTQDWSKQDYLYAQDHLRILSAFYGVVRPLDAIYPYRLEMQTKHLSDRIDNLYAYWNDAIMRNLRNDNDDHIYLNLASKEYAQAVIPYLMENERCIEAQFCVMRDGKRKVLPTIAKMARGKMAAYVIQNRIQNPKDLQFFHEDGWQFIESESSENTFVYVKVEE